MNDLLDIVTGEREPIYVGQGLKERTFEDCVAEGLNPNPNPPGRIMLPQGEARDEAMRSHIKESMKRLFEALKK